MSATKIDAPKPGTLKHAAAIIGVSLPTVYELINSGKLRTYHVGRAHRVTGEAIAECVKLLETEKPTQGASGLRMRIDCVNGEWCMVRVDTGEIIDKLTSNAVKHLGLNPAKASSVEEPAS